MDFGGSCRTRLVPRRHDLGYVGSRDQAPPRRLLIVVRQSQLPVRLCPPRVQSGRLSPRQFREHHRFVESEK
ncbi:MAG: hypothetical protein ACXWUR_01445, partial [Allosphingosinicella sp.]